MGAITFKNIFWDGDGTLLQYNQILVAQKMKFPQNFMCKVVLSFDFGLLG